MFGILKLGRILRVGQMIAFLNVEEDYKGGLNLMMIVIYLIIYIHFSTCFWWYIIKKDQTWIYAGDMESDDYYQSYCKSLGYKYLLCFL
jgi:hypothetical protein